jgi:hypothetical protein
MLLLAGAETVASRTCWGGGAALLHASSGTLLSDSPCMYLGNDQRMQVAKGQQHP